MEGDDLQMIDQCIWLCANAAGESSKLKIVVIQQTKVIDCMSRIISQTVARTHKITKGLLANIIWCCSNLARKPSMSQSDQNVLLQA